MRGFLSLVVALTLSLSIAGKGIAADPLEGVGRIVFLGDSITYSGQYIECLEACMRMRRPDLKCEFLNLGLPSETVSGLSEPGHAGDKFPRPDLHERLERVLQQTKPNLIVACYGMNCGIYHPLSDARFEKFQAGMRLLRKQAAAVNAKVLHVTPPTFDALPIKDRTLPAGRDEYRQPFEGYNQVLDRYSEWLMSQRADGWDVVDVHSAMNEHLRKQRERDPNYRLANDGVHVNATGQWIMAQPILLHWGLPADDLAKAAKPEDFLAAYPHGLDVLKLIQQRQPVLRDAWLSATGHKRPGIKAGLSVDEAAKQAADIGVKIEALLKK